jgi:hypothetical protein
LAGLFVALFAQAPDGPQQVQATVTYSVTPNPVLDPVLLPVVFLPPTNFLPDVTKDQDGDPLSQAQLITLICDAINAWYGTNQPQEGGRIGFDLKVMMATRTARWFPALLLTTALTGCDALFGGDPRSTCIDTRILPVGLTFFEDIGDTDCEAGGSPRDPYNLKEIGYYIPATTPNTDKRCVGEGAAERCKIAIQTNNVEVDDRGYVYAVDRANTGMHILELTGAARNVANFPGRSTAQR